MSETKHSALYELLLCNNCNSCNKNVKILDCLHPICYSCYEECIVPVKQYHHSTLQCKICSVVTIISDFSPRELLKTTMPENILNLVSNQMLEEDVKKQPKCQGCSYGININSAWFCNSCNKFMCDFDAKLHRQVFTDHRVVDNEDLSEQISISGSILTHDYFTSCRLHPHCFANIYCNNEKQWICYQCAYLDHKDHEIFTGCRETLATIKNYQTRSSSCIDDYKEYKNTIKSLLEKLSEDREETVASLYYKFQTLHDELDSIKQNLQSTIDKKYTVQKEYLQKLVQETQQKLNHLERFHEFCNLTIKYGQIPNLAETERHLDRYSREMSLHSSLITEKRNIDTFSMGVTIDSNLVAKLKDSFRLDENRNYAKLHKSLEIYNHKVKHNQVPSYLTLDTAENFYVTGGKGYYVHVYNKFGKLVLKFGGKGSKNGKFLWAWGIVIHNDMIYVSDAKRHDIQVFTMSGKFIKKFGCFGSSIGRYNSPQGLSIDKEGRLFVADRMNNRIQIVNSVNGEFIRTFGVNNLSYPMDISQNSYGETIVLDTGTPSLHVFDKEFNLINSIDSEVIEELHEMKFPWFLTIDKHDNIIVTDYESHSIHIFSQGGRHISSKRQAFDSVDNETNSNNVSNWIPAGLAVNSLQEVFVFDMQHNRIHKF